MLNEPGNDSRKKMKQKVIDFIIDEILSLKEGGNTYTVTQNAKGFDNNGGYVDIISHKDVLSAAGFHPDENWKYVCRIDLDINNQDDDEAIARALLDIEDSSDVIFIRPDIADIIFIYHRP